MSGLLISERFGPTIQGEGPQAGQRCHFLRLGLCNLNCSWCDTAWTWNWEKYDRKEELHRESEENLLSWLAGRPGLIVISGGEPMVQEAALTHLLNANSEAYQPQPIHRFAIETNGTRMPNDHLLDLIKYWTISPKLANSGVPREKAWDIGVLTLLAQRAATFKFVCTGPADFDEIGLLCDLANISPGQVWIMPEGTSAPAIVDHGQQLADEAIDRGYNLTGRMHVILWGNERER